MKINHKYIIRLTTISCVLVFAAGCSVFGSKKSHKRGTRTSVNIQESDPGPVAENADLEADASESDSAAEPQPGKAAGDPIDLASSVAESDYGLRSGSQYFNALLAITGVPKSANLEQTYKGLESALSGPAKLQGFDAGKQSAIIKLSAAVCNDLVDNVQLRTAFFPGINFDIGITQMSDADKNTIAVTTTRKFWGDQDLGMDKTAVNNSIVALINDLSLKIANPENNSSTINIVKGVCSAVAGSFQTIVI